MTARRPTAPAWFAPAAGLGISRRAWAEMLAEEIPPPYDRPDPSERTILAADLADIADIMARTRATLDAAAQRLEAFLPPEHAGAA